MIRSRRTETTTKTITNGSQHDGADIFLNIFEDEIDYPEPGGFWPHDASRTRIVTLFFTHDAYSHLLKN